MKKVDLIIIHASELVTMAGPKRPRKGAEMSEVAAIADGAVAVNGGKVVATGPTKEIVKKFKQAKGEPLDASGMTVIPGFVDAHTHLVFAGSRENELEMKLQGKTYMDILRAGGGIMRTVKATRAASDKALFNGIMERLDRMLCLGTTTAEGKSGYGLDLGTELRSLKALIAAGDAHEVDVVPTFLGAHAIPPEYAGRPDNYVQFIIAKVLPAVAKLKRVEFCDIFCEEGVFTVQQGERLLRAAKALGMGPKVHADEIVRTGGAEMAARVGAMSADHLLRSSPEGIRKMAAAGVIGVLLPGTPLTLMQKEYSDARGMIVAGLPVALATDYNPNCMTESMQLMIALACYNMRMTPSEALAAATINAAYAIGRGETVGSLEPGKMADMVLLDAPNHLFIPYHFGVNLADTVLKAGKVVVRGGRLV
jgi:imidazolonepropionase